MPPKLQDSGSFSIPCDIGGIIIRRALCDLGASVSIMPYSMYAKLKLGDLCPTNVTIRLADRSCRLPRGILKDVPVKVKNLYFPADFIVLDISEDVDIPIILGRPFLYTAKAVIDMDRGSLALRIGNERVVFDLPDMSKNPSLFADCDKLDLSTEGVPDAEQTIGSGKEPCKEEPQPLHAHGMGELLDPGDVFKERTNACYDKQMVRRKLKRGAQFLLYKSRLKLFPGKLRTKWSGPFTVARAYLDDRVKLGTKGGKSVAVDRLRLEHYHVPKHREPPDDIDNNMLLGKESQRGTSREYF
ncbi:unnamed protein product [Rhodiola kirilowii]